MESLRGFVDQRVYEKPDQNCGLNKRIINTQLILEITHR